MPLLFLKNAAPVVRNFFPHFSNGVGGKMFQQSGRTNLAADNYRLQRTYDVEEAKNYARESRGKSQMGDLMPVVVFYSTDEKKN
jgi:hypothetical protein